MTLLLSLLLQLAPTATGATALSSFEEGLMRAAQQERPMALVFAHDTVPASVALAQTLDGWSGPPAVVPVIVDPYDRAEGTALARRYALHYLPSLVLLDVEGQEIERLQQAPDASDLPQLLSGLLQEGPLARLRAEAEERAEDAEIQLTLGRELLSRGDVEGARARLTMAAGQEDAPPRIVARALHDLGLLELRRGDIAAAEGRFRQVVEEHPESRAAQDSALAIAEMLAIEGRAVEAVRALERFRLNNPQHPREAQVEALLERLRAGD